MSRKPPVYQLRITMEEFRPMIWRRVLLPAYTPLARLHDVIQIVNHRHVTVPDLDRLVRRAG